MLVSSAIISHLCTDRRRRPNESIADSVFPFLLFHALGVVGLSTAIRIQETGRYKVTVVAEVLPTDAKTIKYTSQWAGAHHVSFAYLEDPRHGACFQDLLVTERLIHECCVGTALDKETFEELFFSASWCE